MGSYRENNPLIDRPCEVGEKVFSPRRTDQKYCSEACKAKWKKRPHARYKEDVCECCGFIAVHKCQLDVDHIDGNHENNSPTNLRTLCANCHRLKTWLTLSK